MTTCAILLSQKGVDLFGPRDAVLDTISVHSTVQDSRPCGKEGICDGAALRHWEHSKTQMQVRVRAGSPSRMQKFTLLLRSMSCRNAEQEAKNIDTCRSYTRQAGDAWTLLVSKMKRYFPNVAGPRYYNEGRKHVLYFMEYALTTSRAFGSEPCAENWLCEQAIPIVEKTYIKAIEYIERDQERVARERRAAEEKQAVNRMVAGKVKSKVLEIELSLEKCVSADTRAGENNVGAAHKERSAEISMRPVAVSTAENNPAILGMQSNPPGGNLQASVRRKSALVLEPEKHCQASSSLVKALSYAKDESSSIYGEAFSCGAENHMDGILGGYKNSKLEVFPMNESFVKEHDIHLTDLFPARLLDKKPRFAPTEEDAVGGLERESMLSRQPPNLSRRRRKIMNNNAIKEKTRPIVSNVLGAPASLASSEESFTSYGQVFEAEGSRPGEFSCKAKKRKNDVLMSASHKAAPVIPDFRSIYKKIAGNRYEFIDLVRGLCLEYDLLCPEYEIVRENDVYRCTATFCEMNFVSPYLYDKFEAKNAACNRIYEYIAGNWTAVSFYCIEQRRRAGNGP